MPTKKKVSAPRAPAGAPVVADPIEHVVVLMMENRSFDHMLGGLQKVIPEVDGVLNVTQANPDKNGVTYMPTEITATRFRHDPMHYHPNVMFQLDGPQGPSRNFVLDFSLEYPDSSRQEREQIMGYYPVGYLPALHGLAQAFTICDKWFSSLPGPTIPNRLFMHAGTSQGHVNLPPPPLSFTYDPTTVFQRLDERGISWKKYVSDQTTTMFLKYKRFDFDSVDDFFEDASGAASRFPAYSFVEPQHEPAYLPHDMGDGVVLDPSRPANNDHSRVSDIMDGERFIASVYNAIRNNEALWHSTLLVVLFDEHGGFHDHVPPPADAVPPDPAAPPITTDYPHGLPGKFQFRFERLGVRVPALLVSPWVARTVDHTRYDHASVLKYLTEKWGLGDLGPRVAAAQSFAQMIQMASPKRTDDTPRRLEVPSGELPLSDHGRTLVAFSQTLDRPMTSSPALTMAGGKRKTRGIHVQYAEALQHIGLLRDQQNAKRVARPVRKPKPRKQSPSAGRR
jgi:phospholipase C